MFLLSRADKDLRSPVPRNLNTDVPCSAKTVDSQIAPAFDAGKPQAAEPDDPSTQQRRGLQISKTFRQRINKVFVRYRVFGKSTIVRVSSKLRVVAQIFLSTSAEGTHAARLVQPRNSHPSTWLVFSRPASRALNDADNLITGNYGTLAGRQLAFNNVQVSVTNSARGHTHQNLIGFGNGIRHSLERQRIALHRGRLVQQPGLHKLIVINSSRCEM